jgi:hypothetical protein
MPGSQNIPWSRVLVEGTAIVAGILLAFSIDAWWDDRQERASDIARLQGVLEELRSHEILLSEAIAAHQATVDLGYELFELLASGQSPAEKARTAEVMDLMYNFYRINAPFGSLETAVSSGTIARMKNVDLASAVASWPTTIEDLLEEQSNGSEIVVLNQFGLVGQKISLHEVYGHRLANPSGRGTSDIINDVARSSPPVSNLEVDYKDIADDIEIRNGFLQIMMFGQAALAEATLAKQKLDALIERLDDCVSSGGC